MASWALDDLMGGRPLVGAQVWTPNPFSIKGWAGHQLCHLRAVFCRAEHGGAIMEPGSSVDARVLHIQPRPTVALGSSGALAVVWDAARAWASRMCVLGAQLVARGTMIYDHALHAIIVWLGGESGLHPLQIHVCVGCVLQVFVAEMRAWRDDSSWVLTVEDSIR